MTTRRQQRQRRQRPPFDPRPLTLAEEEAVARQGQYLAWAESLHRRATGEAPDGLWTRGVCGGSR